MTIHDSFSHCEGPGALRILLAEDNPDHQTIVAHILGRRGHTVDIAGNGRQAVRMARENRYDAILMDVKMADMDGLEATKAIRDTEKDDRRVPIFALTAYVMKGDQERCLAAGMDGYLVSVAEVFLPVFGRARLHKKDASLSLWQGSSHHRQGG